MDKDIVHVEPYWYNESECLGTGAFGEVYKGHNDQNKNQLLAIKRISKGKLPQNIIDQEIQILQELSSSDVQHANFVTLVDCVQTMKHVYLVMEYCNGGDLDHYLKEVRKMNDEAIRIFLRQIASALKILHDHVIVHRDLKPANILLSHNGSRSISDITFKIADFGLGRFLDNNVQAQTFCGTPVYMAPEIFVPNAKYDYKADLWSLGAIVYQCYTGTLYSAFQKEALKMPANTNPQLQDLVTRLLCKEPKDRINFNDFYNHPFIGMKEVDEAKRAAAKTAAAAGSASAVSFIDDPNRMGWFRRVFSLRGRRPPREDKEKILNGDHALPSNSSSPSQPLSPKAKGAAQNNSPKPVPIYTEETSPRRRMSPPGVPAKNEVARVANQGPPAAAGTPRNRGFFGFLFPNSSPLNPIKEQSMTQLLKTLAVENRDIYGVAHLDMRFYALCRSPSSLFQFSDQSPFIKIKDIDIDKQIKHPQDVVACPASNCLYVTDIGTNCIWKVEAGYPFKITQWASEISYPHTVSVSGEGRVVTFGNHSKDVLIYGRDARLKRSIPLPSDVKAPQHAVETSKGNCIISYGDVKEKKQGVCEISNVGKIVHRFDNKTVKVNHPTHLAIDLGGDKGDRIYVADNCNNRVLQLDSRLRLEQVLPTDEKDKLDKPFRLCLTSVKGEKRLLVQHHINSVDIYNLSH